MSTDIRPAISKRNKWYIDKERYYELLHFCRQYPIWKKRLILLSAISPHSNNLSPLNLSSLSLSFFSPTESLAMELASLSSKIDLIDTACNLTDDFLAPYILKSVTEGASFNSLSLIDGMPASRDTFYDRYRKFFYILSGLRQ